MPVALMNAKLSPWMAFDGPCGNTTNLSVSPPKGLRTTEIADALLQRINTTGVARLIGIIGEYKYIDQDQGEYVTRRIIVTIVRSTSYSIETCVVKKERKSV
ncbi:hypothetical protein CHS0354_023677 [Potamilus streckersoni]|uniref:Uncharacterized protein n=1 Tax=Potamilus streckersoni TaxID=2493646 RepID=A0AAE0SC33_9BIVA|nr:hypothetical protein CHS0354_023677 [Potamilus streckersoni]